MTVNLYTCWRIANGFHKRRRDQRCRFNRAIAGIDHKRPATKPGQVGRSCQTRRSTADNQTIKPRIVHWRCRVERSRSTAIPSSPVLFVTCNILEQLSLRAWQGSGWLEPGKMCVDTLPETRT